jgi:hypothetical protein
MGNDISDVNNDALQDILTLDMLPEDNHRQKLLFAPDNYEKVEINVSSGFYYQYMRNMLHINNGNGTFSEIGQLEVFLIPTGVGHLCLLIMITMDGKIYLLPMVFYAIIQNMDFLKYMGDYLQNRQVMRNDLLELVKQIPSSNVINYIFKNNGNLTFSNVSSQWGLNLPSNSNGAAYADLDNDGDLDLGSK